MMMPTWVVLFALFTAFGENITAQVLDDDGPVVDYPDQPRPLLNVSGRLIYIPKMGLENERDDYLHKDSRYCFRFTWLGSEYDQSRFPQVKNKTCTEYFEKKNIKLCVDPMAVTINGGKPDLDAVLKDHSDVATIKMTDGQVCAKYTIYYNGIPSHVVRYRTRIDIDGEGPMRSGCLSEQDGPRTYEICACVSGYGRDGICNSSWRYSPRVLVIATGLLVVVARH